MCVVPTSKAGVPTRAFLRQLYEIVATMNTLRDPPLRPELPTHFFGRLQVMVRVKRRKRRVRGRVRVG